MGKEAKRSSLNWPVSKKPEADVALELIDLFTSPTVRLVVGKSKSVYYLHRDILGIKCPYFESAFHFYSENGSAQAEQTYLLDDCDYPDAFKMLIMYLYLSRYEVPSGRCISDICVLHAQVYVLAERLCMDDLKAMALHKMSSVLSWTSFSMELEPEVILELLKVVYHGTREDRRWINFSRNEDRTPEDPADEAPADVAPADVAPADEAPANVAPAEVAPADVAPADVAPADVAPADEAPADEALTDEAPADEAPADEPPADEPPADEPPADEPPADEPPADEPPADEPPADEPPADEPPADEPPADEPPADEPPADEASAISKTLSQQELPAEEGQDEMRRLLSHYTARKLKYLRHNADFMAEIIKGGPIVADIIFAM